MELAPERITEDPAQQFAHILDDLHAVCRELAAQRALLEGIAARLDVLDELMPAARRAAQMLDNPVTTFLAARREADARDQRAGTPVGGRRGSRAARRKLPHA